MVRSLVTFAVLAGVGYLLWRALRPQEPQIPSSPHKYEDIVDEMSDDSFPASDPPSFTPVTGASR